MYETAQIIHLRTEVRSDFNIHGTKYFYDAVFHQKSKDYDVVSLPVHMVGQKICPLHEILRWLFITENAFGRGFQSVIISRVNNSWREQVFWPTKVAGFLQHHNFLIFDEKQHPKKIWFRGC